MKQMTFVIFVMILWLSTCSAPRVDVPAPVPTETAMPAATETALPATATEAPVSEGKLPAPSFDSQPYINEEAGFALDYPTGWTVNEVVVGPRGTQVQFLSAPDLAEVSPVPEDAARLNATMYQWDPKNDLAAYVENMKTAWSASGFTILDEQQLTLELGLPAVQFTVQTPEAQVTYLIAALKDQYLVLSGEGNLALTREIMQRLRPISN